MEIKPAAWIERNDAGNTVMWSGDLSAWALRPANPEPLYDQSTVDALRKDAVRFTWLIENCSSNGGLGVEIFIGEDAPDAAELAATIDAAMREQGANV